jgi:hypothetical protein
MIDASLEANVTLGAIGSHVDLVARYSGPGDKNMYVAPLVRLSATTADARIFANVNGMFTLLNSTVINFSGSGTLRFEVVQNSLRVYVNGTLVVQATDNTFSGPGLVGIRTSAGATVDNFASLLTPSGQTALPFAENFALGANTTLGAPWTIAAGSYSIQAQAAVGVQSLNLATIGASLADVSVQANVTLASGSGFSHVGLVARQSGPGDANMYVGMVVRLNGSLLAQIYRNVNGTWSLLGQNAISAAGTIGLRFDAIGTTLNLYVNGVLEVTATDSALAAGSVGVRSSASVSIDDFNASQRLQLVSPVPFQENFTGATGAPLSGFWREHFGALSIQGGTAVTAGATLGLATLIGGSLTDVSLTTDVTLQNTAGSNAGIVARYTGSADTNMYLGNLVRNNGTTTAQILVNVNGVWTVLASANVNVSGTATLRFDVVGNSLKLFVNGDLVAFAFDSSLASGQVGLRGAAATFDNFTSNLRLLTTPTLPFTDSFAVTAEGQLGSNWRELAGNFSVETAAAVGQTSINLAIVNGVTLTNSSQTASVALTTGDFSFAGLVARHDGPGDTDMYLGMLKKVGSSYFAQIFRNVGGVWTQLSSTAVSGSGTVTLRFDVIGTSLQLFVNDTLSAFAFDSNLTSGSVGIRSSQNVSIDDYSVSSAS